MLKIVAMGGVFSQPAPLRAITGCQRAAAAMKSANCCGVTPKMSQPAPSMRGLIRIGQDNVDFAVQVLDRCAWVPAGAQTVSMPPASKFANPSSATVGRWLIGDQRVGS